MSSPNNAFKLKYQSRYYWLICLFSLAALTATFFVSTAELTFKSKLLVFAAVTIAYFSTFALLFFRADRAVRKEEFIETANPTLSAEIESNLQALEEANLYFGASLTTADMFRLVANRVKEIIPHADSAIYLTTSNSERLKLGYTTAESAKSLIGTELQASESLISKIIREKKALIDNSQNSNFESFTEHFSKDYASAVAVPLYSKEKVFAVLVLYDVKQNAFDQNSLVILEAVGIRAATLFQNSKTFENNLSNALTDSLTDLPNERALYLVLENQIAEAIRFRGDRFLTVLAVDISDFFTFNEQYGYADSERMLIFAAKKIKNQLRQMDFLARSVNDEFLAVLPTATEKITKEVISRIEKTFITNSFELSTGENIYLQLRFGAASFGRDGESAGQLIQTAAARKQQAGFNPNEGKIIMFPKEFVN